MDATEPELLGQGPAEPIPASDQTPGPRPRPRLVVAAAVGGLVLAFGAGAVVAHVWDQRNAAVPAGSTMADPKDAAAQAFCADITAAQTAVARDFAPHQDLWAKALTAAPEAIRPQAQIVMDNIASRLGQGPTAALLREQEATYQVNIYCLPFQQGL